MNKFTIIALGMASAASLTAQSLFDLAPADEASESIPLSWTFSAGVGYDDNATPISFDQDSSYGTASIGASLLSVAPQTRLEFFANVGVIHYFDDLDIAGQSIDQSTATYGFGLNWTREISERLRFSSRNYATHELEPNRASGIGGLNQVGAYARMGTDNSIGYRWSERLGTYTGISYSDLSYDDFSGNDVEITTFYNDFRYQLSPQTVATLTYRYSESDLSVVADSTNQYILAGLEHRFSPTTIGVLRAGAQLRDVDGGSSTTSPNLEASLKTRVNSQLSLNAYARYTNEDYVRRLANAIYDDAETLRLGVSASYALSPRFAINTGVNYNDIGYDGLRNGAGLASPSEDIFNYYLGFSMSLTDTVSLSGNWSYEDFGSDVGGREYDRNRLSLGVSAQF